MRFLIRSLPRAVIVLSLLLYLAGGWLAATRGELAGVPAFTLVELAWPIPMLAFAAVGAFVASRRPRNSVAWFFVGIGFLMAFNYFCESYARAALVDDLPLAHVTAWLAFWTWVPAVGLFPFAFLLFPDGRVHSRRWMPVVGLAVAVQFGAIGASFLVLPNSTSTLVRTVNLGAVEGGALLALIANNGIQLLIVAAMVSLVLRFRRASGDERQQLKWFAFGAALMVVSILAMAFLPYEDPFSVGWVAAMFTVAVSSLPVAAGVAILKYRLYDIDLVINKTLVYVSLTAVLAFCYFALIVVLQRVLPMSDDSDIAVAASTLAVAALFQPLRTRLQAFIDRRFYRRKYDAAETLGEFSGRMREQVDLESLNRELIAVVSRTMQPTHVSLWVREEALQ